MASELSTPVDVIELWPIDKAIRYYEAAMRLLKAKSGKG